MTCFIQVVSIALQVRRQAVDGKHQERSSNFIKTFAGDALVLSESVLVIYVLVFRLFSDARFLTLCFFPHLRNPPPI